MADPIVSSAPAASAAGQQSSAPIQEAQKQDSQSQENSAPEGVVANLAEKAATGTPSEKAQAKKMLKTLKIKYNGREYDEALPFEIPDDPESVEYMRGKLQMDKMARGKAQEYSNLEKEVRAFVEELRKNPKKALSDPSIGIDMKNLAKEIIEEEIANSQKSPEQLAKEKLEAELKALKEEREKEKEEMSKKELERLQEQEFERYDTLMTKALEGSKLPKSPYVVKKMADYLMLGLQSGLDVTPEDVLPLVESEMQSDLKEMFAVMPDEVIEALVGKDVITRIRKKNIAKVKGGGQPPVPLKTAVKDIGGKSQAKAIDKKQSFKEFFKV